MSAPHHPDRPASGAPTAATGWMLAAVVAISSVGLSLLTVAATGQPENSAPADDAPVAAPSLPSTEPSKAPSGAPPAGNPGNELSPEAAEDVLSGFLRQVSLAAADPADPTTTLDGVAVGAALAEFQNEQAEFAGYGWSRRGADAVLSATITRAEPEADPPSATVTACIDSSDVRLLDADGDPIDSGRTADEKRATNIYTLVLTGGSWQVADRTFPDDAAC